MFVNLFLVRHAHAGDRGRWTGPDSERPLSPRGRDQAAAVLDALAGLPIRRVMTSPATRCVQTVDELARRLGVELEITSMLAEGSPVEPVRKLVDGLVRDGDDAVMCAHGDVLPELLRDLELDGTVLEGSGCAKGSIWHLIAENGRVVRGRYERHPDGPLHGA